MEKVLVTGGCGYIGSHTLVDLVQSGYEVISIDNLSNSSDEVLGRIEAITGVRVTNYRIDLCDRDACAAVFEEHPDISGIIHFAAYKAVGESVAEPLKYYYNNLGSTINILHFALLGNVQTLVYSSSCTVYGIPEVLPVVESSPVRPAESPYGHTKQMGEQILRDTLRANSGLSGISLRYFNPAGAHPSGLIGESPVNEALNLVPVITETAIGRRQEVVIFGDDYATRDGTCVRDYIHVCDLARAHRLALEASRRGDLLKPFDILNLGIGQGVTVLEAINAFESSTGVDLNYRIGPRRPGDVPAIYSDYTKAAKLLGWEPEFDIKDIMRTAWIWERARSGAQGASFPADSTT